MNAPISADPPPRRHSLAAAFGYAFAGLRAAWRTQRNVRVHALVALIVVAAGIALRLPLASWALVALAIGLVLAAELLNTALEGVVDLVSPDDHPLAKRAKDVAAAGVLVASLAAAAVGAFVFWERLAPR
jgi:undecaprenol kinase